MVLLSKIKKMCPTACDPLTVRNVVQFKNQKTYLPPPPKPCNNQQVQVKYTKRL